MPFLDCFARALARARNDGRQWSLALAMTGRRFHRHGEAAKPPKQSRVQGRGAPALDCFALASLALAFTVKGIWIASPALSRGLAMTGDNGPVGSQ
jgi:hypothetical protein